MFRLDESKFGGDVFMLVFVDDILILSDTDEGLEYAVQSLHTLYEVRGAERVDWFLGVQID